VRTNIYEMLKRLHSRHGPRKFGIVCQKFVAIAYRTAGLAHVVERGVQGVDVDAANGVYTKYAIEVKTTSKAEIQLKRKDLDGLKSRTQDGYLPLLGVLRLRPLSNWWLAAATELRVGCLCIESLFPYRCKDLEEFIQPHFDHVVEQHFEEMLVYSPAYLDGILRRMGVEIRQT
jgi:Holliday junction resolvase